MSIPKHIVSAAVIVMNDEHKILLIKGPKRGWEMPGGQVEEGEALKDAAIREVKEESGIEIEITKFCGSSICNTLFLGRPIGGKLTTSSESIEVGYYSIEHALDMVTWKNFKERIKLCLDEKSHPFLIEF